jgi:hypothetical protein
MLAATPSVDLRAYFVWTPMLASDNPDAASLAARPIDDERAGHYWDPQRHIARALGAALGISATESIPMARGAGAAWDVYLAYARGDADLFAPRLWMHQLAVQHAPHLDVQEWRSAIEALLTSPP